MKMLDKIVRKNMVINRKNIDLNRNIISVVLLVGYLVFTAIYFS